MPFTAFREKKTIEEERMINLEFVQAWDESRTEYKLLAYIDRKNKLKIPGLYCDMPLVKQTGEISKI